MRIVYRKYMPQLSRGLGEGPIDRESADDAAESHIYDIPVVASPIGRVTGGMVLLQDRGGSVEAVARQLRQASLRLQSLAPDTADYARGIAIFSQRLQEDYPPFTLSIRDEEEL